MERSSLEGLVEGTREQFEFVAAMVPEQVGWVRNEWRRIGTLYYTRCEILDDQGNPVAIHDEDGKCWIIAKEIAEPASTQADPAPWS